MYKSTFSVIRPIFNFKYRPTSLCLLYSDYRLEEVESIEYSMTLA